jgi:hypothetical protein
MYSKVLERVLTKAPRRMGWDGKKRPMGRPTFVCPMEWNDFKNSLSYVGWDDLQKIFVSWNETLKNFSVPSHPIP